MNWACPKCGSAQHNAVKDSVLAFCLNCSWTEGDPMPIPDHSRRERIATAALQGLCAAVDDYSPSRFLDVDRFADDALAMADALIKQLDAPPNE